MKPEEMSVEELETEIAKRRAAVVELEDSIHHLQVAKAYKRHGLKGGETVEVIRKDRDKEKRYVGVPSGTDDYGFLQVKPLGKDGIPQNRHILVYSTDKLNILKPSKE